MTDLGYPSKPYLKLPPQPPQHVHHLFLLGTQYSNLTLRHRIHTKQRILYFACRARRRHDPIPKVRPDGFLSAEGGRRYGAVLKVDPRERVSGLPA